MIIEVLTEGASDVPVLRELLSRHFNLIEHEDFRIHPHKGKGSIPVNVNAPANSKHRGLLDQLPAKLRGFGRYMDDQFLVVVLIDADNDDPEVLLGKLAEMLDKLELRPPRVLFRLAVEETESWFLADRNAISKAFPNVNIANLPHVEPDTVVGAWEQLAEYFGRVVSEITGSDKTYWAEKIAPHIDFSTPRSPSLASLVSGIKSEIGV